MSNTFEIAVALDPTAVREATHRQLEGHKFRLVWTDEWHAVAERGSTAGAFFGGVMTPHYKLDVQLMTGPDGSTIVRLSRDARTFTGSLTARMRVDKEIQHVSEELVAGFGSMGVLKGSRAA